MEFMEKHKRAVFILVILLCIAAAMITLNYKRPTFVENLVGYVVAPTQEVTTGIGDWFGEKIDFISNLNALEEENKALKSEIGQLKTEMGRLELLEKDNERLTAQLELRGRYPAFSTEGAYVSAIDSNNWSSSFEINKGTKDGIERNMVVLADGGLVGRVYKANLTSSQVIPIIDDGSSVGAQAKRTGELGFVKGDLTLSESGYCRMENIDINADILENDEIVTSLLGDVYPPGITIGFVREIHLDPDGLTKQAIISPVADFKRLDTVLIINELFAVDAKDDTAADIPGEAIDEDVPAEIS
ncbi:MAG: rod shape-determining protein MreC [Clostridiales bacterium]|jgi:rod shape-determining protein MreC|nr:rod shape-determining protein MreC [Clostridiales bacterium]